MKRVILLICNKIDILDKGAFLTTYLLKDVEDGRFTKNPRPSVVIFPGGGYGMLCNREAEPIAMKFLSEGYHAFILSYSVDDSMRYPQPLLEASKALSLIRQNAEEWHIDPSRIATCGFSAGSHLSATLGTQWSNPITTESLGITYGENRPNAMILAYPVITAIGDTHRPSFERLFGPEPTEEQLKSVSTELHVSKDTPPTFMFHTADDALVPVTNSLIFGQKLAENGIPFELHIYQSGIHGLGLVTKETHPNEGEFDKHVGTWISLAIEWLDKLFNK